MDIFHALLISFELQVDGHHFISLEFLYPLANQAWAINPPGKEESVNNPTQISTWISIAEKVARGDGSAFLRWYATIPDIEQHTPYHFKR